MKLFAGNSNKELFKEIAQILGQKLGDVELKKFSDGESIAVLKEDVEGEKVVIMQSTFGEVNEHLMDLMIMGNAALSNGASEVHAVIPYFGYARQDRVADAGEPITTKLIVDLLQAAGFSSVVSMDIHSHATIDYCKVPFENLLFFPTLVEELKGRDMSNFVIVAPDGGAFDDNKKYAEALNLQLCCIKKKRSAAEKIKTMELEGDVEGDNVLIVDDLIGTGGTLVKAAALLKKEGAKEIVVAATHGVFCGDALKNFEKSEISEVIVSNSITQKKGKKVKVLSVAKEFAEYIEKNFK